MTDDGLAIEILDRLWLECKGTARFVEFSTWPELSRKLKLDLTGKQLHDLVTQLERAGKVRYTPLSRRQRVEQYEHSSELPSEHKITILDDPANRILRRLEEGPISVLLDDTTTVRLGTLCGLPATYVDEAFNRLVDTEQVERILLPGRKTYVTYKHAFS